MTAIDLNRQASEIIALAQKRRAEQNFLFITTFKRYQVQLKILGHLEKELSDSGILVTKEYVKGRQNIYSVPDLTGRSAVAGIDYSKTTDFKSAVIHLKYAIILYK